MTHHHTGSKAGTGYHPGAVTDSLADGMGQLKDDASNMAKTAVKTAQAGMTEVKETARRSLTAAKRTGTEHLEAIADKVSDRPLTSLALAVGVGVLIGMVMSRRGD